MKAIETVAGARRAMLAALGGLVGGWLLAGRSAAAQPAAASAPARRREMQAVQAEYRRLLPLWQEERKGFSLSSNPNDYWSGPHGRAIIALGAAIMPQLIAELRKGDFFFNVPLARMTGVDIADGAYKSEQADSALWLKWWDDAAAKP